MIKIILIFAVLLALFTACNTNNNEPAPYTTEALLSYSEYEETLYESTPGVLPSIFIETAAGNIHRTNWRGTTVALRNAGEYSFSPVTAQIRGRGNSSWNLMGEKRPFRLRFTEPVEMPGGGHASPHWSFIANAMDFSLLRSYAAYYLGELLSGFDYSPTHQFVHVYLSGNYRGVYMISDQMEVAPARVNITRHSDPARSEYFVQWCRHPRSEGDVRINVGANNTPFQIRYPGGRRLTDGHVDFVRDFLSQVDDAMMRMDHDAILQLIDLQSFIDFYIVQEFFKNADVGFSSVFFTIRQTEEGPRLFAGPLWDFDQAAGNTYVRGWYMDYGPRGAWVIHANHWMRNFIIIPNFRTAVAARWYEIRENEIEQMIQHLEYINDRYRDCFDRNFGRWPYKLGNYLWRTPRTIQALDTREGQVDHLLDWFRQRRIWMDGFLLETV